MGFDVVREIAPMQKAANGDGRLIFRLNPDIKGTIGAFGYNYFTAEYGDEPSATIRDSVSAIFGPVSGTGINKVIQRFGA
jgi:hypothetical protein